MAILVRGMTIRKVATFVLTILFSFFLLKSSVAAQYRTCCRPQYLPNGAVDPAGCGGCDTSGKMWLGTGSSCGGNPNCGICSVDGYDSNQTIGNACGGGGGGPTPAPVKRACGEACTTTADCRNPSTGGFPVECRNNKCQLPLTGPYACAE